MTHRIIPGDLHLRLLQMLEADQCFGTAQELKEAPVVEESLRLTEQLGTRVWFETPSNEPLEPPSCREAEERFRLLMEITRGLPADVRHALFRDLQADDPKKVEEGDD